MLGAHVLIVMGALHIYIDDDDDDDVTKAWTSVAADSMSSERLSRRS